MPRLTTVNKSQVAQQPCMNCRAEIPVGSPYKWASKKTGPRSSFRMVWCATCRPKQSQLTSGHTQVLAEITEGLDESLGGEVPIEDIKAALEKGAEEVRSEVETYRDGADNIEQGFGHETDQSQQMTERADELDSWADDLDAAASEVEGIGTELDELTEELENLREKVPNLEEEYSEAMVAAARANTEEASDALTEVSVEMGEAKARIDELEGLVENNGKLEEAQEKAAEAVGACP